MWQYAGTPKLEVIVYGHETRVFLWCNAKGGYIHLKVNNQGYIQLVSTVVVSLTAMAKVHLGGNISIELN